MPDARRSGKGRGMHAVLITFESAVTLEALAGPIAAYARAQGSVPGLLAKTWLRDGATLGTFQLFADRQAAEGYLSSELGAGLTANPAFTRFRIEHYAVLEEVSGLTGKPPPVAV
jgi:hypothetical protein